MASFIITLNIFLLTIVVFLVDRILRQHQRAQVEVAKAQAEREALMSKPPKSPTASVPPSMERQGSESATNPTPTVPAVASTPMTPTGSINTSTASETKLRPAS